MTTEKVSFREKLSYSAGDFASVLYWQTFMIYLLYFYTDVFGISAAAAGTMFLVSRILDGITDPVVGMIADRTETRWGEIQTLSALVLCALRNRRSTHLHST